MPPPPRKRQSRAKKTPEAEHPQEPVTPVTTDTPPEDPQGPTLEEAMAEAAAAQERQERTRPRAAASRAPRATKADKLEASLAELLSMPALAYAASGDTWAAGFVAERAPVMANAWVELGKENPAVMRVLQKITTTSAWGGVIMATGGTVLPLLIHHNLLPDIGLPLPGGGGIQEGPVVPPPPAEGPPPPGPATNGVGVVGRPPPPQGFTDMTPPVKPGAPPGVVTVASTNNQAVNRPD